MNKLFCLIVMFITYGVCEAQIPDWEWARSAVNHYSGVTARGEGWDMVTDPAGNIYAAGWFRDDSLDFGPITIYSTNSNPNGYDVFLAKYDSTGNVVWVKGSRGTGRIYCFGTAIDLSGNLYITGVFDNQIIFDNDTMNTNGDNIFLAKYDSSGSLLWAKKAKGSSANAKSRSVACDPLRNVYITGEFKNSIIFGSDTLTSSGNFNAFTVKYDSSGNVLWARSGNGNGTDYDIPCSVTTNLSGDAFITGYFTSPQIIFNTDTLTLFNSLRSLFVVKYDSSGNVIFAKNSIGGDLNMGNCIATSPSKNIYTTGLYNNLPIIFGSDTLMPSSADHDGYLVKYDSTGNVLWAKSILGAWPCKIILDSTDNIYMIGSMGVPGNPVIFDMFTLQVPSGSTDPMFIAKFDSSGSLIWAKAMQSGGDGYSGIALGTGSSIYITSDFYDIDPFILGCDSLNRTGEEDFFIAKLRHNPCDSTTSVNENYQTIDVLLFPNPVNSDLIVEAKYNQQLEIFICDITSRKLLQTTFTNSVSLNTGQLAKGIYLYEVRNKNEVIKKGKVVKD